MYETIIGLEIHCELKTNSKNFSSSKNSYEEISNINLDPTCLGYPGILPVVNKEAVKSSLKVAQALHCEIPEKLVFDRKNYFYPDLPKGYQITQLHHPIGTNGYLMVHVDGEDKKVLIHDTHLEEDTANLTHVTNYSLINYNRAGVPLLETVTEPCITSVKEAIAFLEALRSMFLYLGVSDADASLGQIRCDVNVSLRKVGDTKLGTRVEMKNINSFGNVEKALISEIKRQTAILEHGGVIEQETRRYSDSEDTTYLMRSKEDAIDYKYYMEPNLPPITLTDEFLEEVKREIPLLPYERIKIYLEEYGLTRVDATTLVKEKDTSDYFDSCVKLGLDPKIACNWIITNLLSIVNKEGISIKDLFLTPSLLKQIIDLLDEKKISSKQAKELLIKSIENKKNPKDLVKELGMTQVTDENVILSFVKEVLNEQPEAIETYKSGRDKILDFLVGQVMKKSRGQANPALASKLLIEEMEKM